MRRPLRSWKNLLGSLGLQVVERPARSRCISRPRSFESLETRSLMAADVAGVFDTQFGNGRGYALQELINNNIDGVTGQNAVHGLIQTTKTLSDGSILVGGTTQVNDGGGSTYNSDYFVAKFTSAGVLDTTFGDRVDPGSSTDFSRYGIGIYHSAGADDFFALDVDAAGNIIVAGQGTDGGVLKAKVVQFTSTGVVDVSGSFGTSGVQAFDFYTGTGADSSAAKTVKVVGTGSSRQIYVGGFASYTSGQSDSGIARLNDDGSLDTSYDTDGIQLLDLQAGYGDSITSLIVDGSGNAYALANSRDNSSWSVLKLDSTGQKVTGFGSSGVSEITFTSSANGTSSINFDNSGNLILGGWYAASPSTTANTKAALVSMNSGTGALITSFGGAGTGIATLDFGVQQDFLFTTKVMADGKIAFVGQTNYGVNDKYTAIMGRLNSNGTPDTSFGPDGNGRFQAAFGDYDYSTARGLSITSAGQVVVGGYAQTSSTSPWKMVVSKLTGDAPTVTGGGIADIVVQQSATSSTVNLNNAFADTYTADSALEYLVVGSTNPELFSSTSISAGILTINYPTFKAGTSVVTVRAKDQSGQATEITFKVSVNGLRNGGFDGSPTVDWTKSVGTFTSSTYRGTGLSGTLTQKFPATNLDKSNTAIKSEGQLLNYSFKMNALAGSGGTADTTVTATINLYQPGGTVIARTVTQTYTLPASQTTAQTYQLGFAATDADVGLIPQFKLDYSRTTTAPTVVVDSVFYEITESDLDTEGWFYFEIIKRGDGESGFQYTNDDMTTVPYAVYGANWRDAALYAFAGSVHSLAYTKYGVTQGPFTYTFDKNDSGYVSVDNGGEANSGLFIGTIGELDQRYPAANYTGFDIPSGMKSSDKVLILNDAASNTDYDDYYWQLRVTKIHLSSSKICLPCIEGVLGNANGSNGPANPSAGTSSGVEAGTGAVNVTNPFVSSSGYGAGFGSSLTWSSNSATSSQYGAGMSNPYQPMLMSGDGGNQVLLNFSGFTNRFKKEGSTYVPIESQNSNKLTYSSSTFEYAYTDTAGNVLTFHGWDSSIPALQRGQVKSQQDPAGNLTNYTYDSNGRLDYVTRVDGSNTEKWDFTFITTNAQGNIDLVDNVVYSRNSATVRTIEYKYGETAPLASNVVITSVEQQNRRLQTVVVKDASNAVLDTTYFRYYSSTETDGANGALKLVLRPESVTRAIAAGITNLATASDADLKVYADLFYKYDTQGRVKEVSEQGSSCSTCSTSGTGTTTYAYAQSNFANGYNSWKFKTMETLPDGTVKTYYTNFAGQKLLDVHFDGTNTWRTFYQYDDEGRMILQANPSAVTGHDESKADLLNKVSGNFQYLADSTGLITTYSYYSGLSIVSMNQSFAPGAGGVDGYLRGTSIKQGETGTAIKQNDIKYFAHQSQVDGSYVYAVASDTVYRNTDGTGAHTNSYSYNYYVNDSSLETNQLASSTVTLPFVSAAQNGSDAVESGTTVYDQYGRAIWRKNAAGFLSYMAYDVRTGAVIKMIRDVNTSNTSDFANLPSGWTTPSGGGLHLTTNFEVDNLGRTIKMVDPKGNITYTVYNDAANEVRTYRGWDATNQRPTGPVELSRGELTGSYTHNSTTYYGTFTEYLTYSVFGSLQVDGSGRPVGNEAVNGSGSGLGYTYTTTLQTLSRSLSNAGGQRIMSDQYTDFTGMTYAYTTPTFVVSGAVQGTNFERTEYGYDKRGRQTRVLDAEGTINRTFYDQQDRVVSTWIGTDDTPTTGLWSPTNTSGTDLVQLSSMAYDNGGVGDGNLTSSTQIPGGGLVDRTTAYFYDWRNRTVAVKSGVETTTESTSVNRALSYTEYDNLNQTLASYIYDGDGVTITSTAGVPNQPSSSLLRAKNSADYDDQGRVFKSTRYEVDQTSGTIGSGTIVTQSFHDIRGLTSKTRDARNNDTTYAYDGVGRQTTVTSPTPSGGTAIVSQTNYDANGNVTSSVLNPASDNFVTAYTYDALDRRVTVTQQDPDGAGSGNPLTSPVTTYAYNAAGWLETVTDSLSRVTKTEYDRLGRTIKKILPDPTTGTITGSSPIYQTTYNGVGNVLTTTDALGNVTTYAYNYLHQRISTTQADPDGPGSGNPLTSPVSYATYSVGGDLLTTTDPEGRVTTYEYDLLGRQFQVTMPDPDGPSNPQLAARMTYTFDTLGGVLTSTDRLSHVTSSAYDGLHRLATSTNANSEATTFTYDSNSNRLTLTDPNGNETSWVYDELNRVTSETNELNKTRSFTYDTAGRLHTRTDRLNRVIEYVYDNLSRVTAEKWGTTSVTPTTQYTWTYDAAGQMLTGGNSTTREYVNTYDKLGRVTQIDTNEFGSSSVYDLNMTYDINGNRLTRSHAANTATWVYDFLNRAKIVSATGAVGTYGATFGYNSASQMTFQENFDTSVSSGTLFSHTDYIFDDAGRLQDITHLDASNNPFATYGYSWDASDRITAVDFLDGVYDNEDVDYSYDAAGQVTGADRTGSGTDEAYDYDTNGNRESVTRDGSTATWGVGINNQITSDGTNSYTYDDEGNLTSDGVSTYYWDNRNRLIEVRTGSTGVMFTYDHNNLRVGKCLDLNGDWDYSDSAELDTQTSYYFDGGRMVREVSADGTVENNYLFNVNAHLIALEDVASNVVEFAYSDHLGSVRDVIVVDAGTAVHTEHNAYDSYGRVIERQQFDGTTWNVVASESIVSLGYTGEYFEVSIGLQYNWNRWYNANTGRWISEDPIGFSGGDVNLGRYTGNASPYYVDPTGLDTRIDRNVIQGLFTNVLPTTLWEILDVSAKSLYREIHDTIGIGAALKKLNVAYTNSSVAIINEKGRAFPVTNVFGIGEIGQNYVITFNDKNNSRILENVSNYKIVHELTHVANYHYRYITEYVDVGNLSDEIIAYGVHNFFIPANFSSLGAFLKDLAAATLGNQLDSPQEDIPDYTPLSNQKYLQNSWNQIWTSGIKNAFYGNELQYIDEKVENVAVAMTDASYEQAYDYYGLEYSCSRILSKIQVYYNRSSIASIVNCITCPDQTPKPFK